MSEPNPHAVVVGGSLSGLCAGLALARAGWTVTILERAAGEPPGGAGLGLDRRARGADRTVQGDLYVSATTAMLFFAGVLLVALIIIALLTLRHSPNPLITSTSKETLS